MYQYKDHLGNIRLSYAKNPATQVLTIIDENNYYPFGLKHTGYNDYVATNNKYKYNGKELQDELGLGMYDYGFRNYDPALGRWMNIDPLAEISRRWSPYTYAYDNPVLLVDVDGLYVDTSWIYRKNKDGNYVNKKLVEAFETFAKSKEGISFLGSFAEKGQVIAGHEYSESGKFDKKDIDLNFVEAKSEESVGDAYTSKETKGKNGLQITVNLFPSAKTDALIDDIGHESFLHADPIAKDFDDDKKFNLSPIDKDIVKQLEDENYPKKWRENAAHHMQDMRYNILDKKVLPILRNYYNSKNIKKTDAQIRKERPRGY
ncbi:RHS repeat domain-containing protein [Flavobacterium lipolyticum]|uniref:RHS repeat domain-containing protein n=1 Tax=Flavobacterium lipolyticum TaxID=2893754 RepID=UPI003D16850D